MFKNKYFYITLAVVVSVFIFFFATYSYFKMSNDFAYSGEISLENARSDINENEENGGFVLRKSGNNLVIYKKSMVGDLMVEQFYDYANLNYDMLGEDIIKSIHEGIYFDSEKQLYEFLQNYSS